MAQDSVMMDVLQLAGRLIMESGGEIHRVEDTVRRMAGAFRLEEASCFAVPSGVFIGYRRADGTTETSVTRVTRGETNLWRVNEVNAVSRRLVSEQLEPEQVMRELERIRDSNPVFAAWQVIAGAAFSALGFCLLFGGGWAECALSAFAAAVAQAVCQLINRSRTRPLMGTVFGSFAAAVIPGVLALVCVINPEPAVAGALMPFVPGLAMTNAVADLIRGDMLSGVSHGFSALLTAGMIATGTILGNGLLRLLGGGLL